MRMRTARTAIMRKDGGMSITAIAITITIITARTPDIRIEWSCILRPLPTTNFTSI